MSEVEKRRTELQRAERDANQRGLTVNQKRNKDDLLARARRRLLDAEEAERRQLARR